MTSNPLLCDEVKTGEKIAYYLEVEGTTISSASWTADGGASIVDHVETDTQSTALVSFPSEGRCKVIGILELANGGRLIGSLVAVVTNP